MFFIGFSILSYSTGPQATTGIEYTKPYAKPSQSNLSSRYIYIYIYIDNNTLRAKHATHQKAEYLRAASQHG